MRKLKLFISLLLITHFVSGQMINRDGYSVWTGSMYVGHPRGVSINAPNTSAYLEVGPTSSANKGFLPPRLSTAERDAIASPATGLMIYNKTTNDFQGWNGSAWVNFYIDTAASFISSFYRIGDSVKYVKGGVHTFAFKDSTGGGNFGLQDILATSARYFNAASYKFAVKNIPTNGFSGLFSGDSSDINNSSAGGYYSFTQSELPATILGVRSSYGAGINSYISVNKNSEAEIDLSTNYISSSRIIINPYAGITITPADSILKITSLQSGTITDSVILWRASDKSVRKITLSALSSGLSGWSLSGNAVSALGTDYLGSTNGNPILFKLGSVSSGIINGSGADANTSFGYGVNNTDSNSNAGAYNSAFGYNSLAENTGSFNSAFGTSSLSVNTSGSQNAAFGTNSLLSNTTGQKNTSVGSGSLENNTSGDDNTAIGQDALLANTTGIRNIGIGWNGFANNFTGGQNIGIGYGAGKTITNGNNNTILGAFAAWDAAQNDTITGAVIIGHSATASEDSTVVLGNDYIKKTHLKGVVYAPFTAGSATTSDSALVVDRSTGALIMRPVAGGGGSSSLSSITAATATNTINNGNYKQEWQWDNLSSGYGLDLTSSTTSPASTVGLLNSTIDGANSNAGITSYAIIGQNYKTGTSSTNYGASFTASGGTTNIGARFTAAGGTNNYAITVPSSGGSVGIGTETPASKLHTVGTVRHATLGTASGDTTTNKPVGINSSGDIIPMTHWPGGGGSYTFSSGVNEVAGTVKLGGDLVNSTSINGKGSYSVTLDSLTGFTVKSPGLTKILTTSTQAYIYGNSSSTYMGVGTELFLAQQKSGNSISMSSDSFVLKMGGNSQLIIRPDSLNINPPLGIAIIDTLAAASNMTNKRVMTWDTVTKRWEQIAKDSVGGGGSTSPAGNYGNLQINRNGAFATPGSDSLIWASATGLTSLGNIGVGVTTSTHRVSILDNQTTRDVLKIRNLSASGYSSIGFFGYTDAQVGGFGYANGGIAGPVSDAIYFYSNSKDLVFSKDATATSSMTIRGATGTVGIVNAFIGSATGTATARLHISAPTSTANTGQLKLASGTPPTTPEIGLINFQDGLLFLDSSNSNRDTVATRDWVNYKGYVSTRDRFGFSGEDVLSSADRTFNLNNNKFDFDSGSVHIRRKVDSPRSDDIFSVSAGPNKAFYVTQLNQTYAGELYAGANSFYAIGGASGFTNSQINLSGTTFFQSFQKKFEINKSWPGLADSIGFEIKNDTFGISTLGSTWADTYKIASLKYRSGVDNSLIERFDFRGNGDFNITGTGATKFQSGNTSQRPSSSTTGMMRYNTDSTSFEYYNGSAWLKFGTSSGGSDGYVDNATFNTTTNYLTIEQTGAADVSVRIPPSYIRNSLNADSISKKENDSTLLLKAITVTTNNNRLTTTVTRTDSTLNFLVDIKRDTVTLASFGAGGGQAGDTTAFSTSTIYGSFYNDGTDTLVITSMRGILQGTSPSVTYDVYYNDSLNVTAGASKLVTAGTALTNTATGAAVTSFDNTKIPPGVWVWVKTTTVTTKPTYFSLSLVGYKSRKA